MGMIEDTDYGNEAFTPAMRWLNVRQDFLKRPISGIR